MRPLRSRVTRGQLMQLDPSVKALFEQMPLLANYPLWEKSPHEARAEFRAMCQLYDPKIVPIGKTENVDAVGPAGTIQLRIYTPVAAGATTSLPAIVYF